MSRDLLFIISVILCAIELYLFRYTTRTPKVEILFIVILILILAVNRMMGVK